MILMVMDHGVLLTSMTRTNVRAHRLFNVDFAPRANTTLCKKDKEEIEMSA